MEFILSKQIFAVAKEEYNRSSEFFEKNVRDYEYAAIIELALEALEYDDIVLINAPFADEVRNEAYMEALRNKLEMKNTRLTVIWVNTDVAVCKQRMIDRNSDRDRWKLDHWDEYIATVNFDIPNELNDPLCKDDLLVFNNSSQEEFERSMEDILHIIEG